MAFAADLLLVFSLVLITIGVVAVLRLRRHRQLAAPAVQSAQSAPSAQATYGQRSTGSRSAPAPSAGASAEDYAQAPGSDYDAAGAYGYAPGGSTTVYPGGMDAEAAEIERLKAEIAMLKAYGGDSSGFKRTQTLVAVAANVSGVLGLLVSVAALLK
jgi:hypothetical protein